MKRLHTVGMLVLGLLTACVFIACASDKKSEPPQAKVPEMSNQVERVTLDHKGAALGADIPQWVFDANNDDYAAIAKLPQFENKVIIIESAEGQNLDMLKSWVNNFSVQSSVSRRISSVVEARFGGTQLGSKNTPENQNFLKEIVATFSQVNINGLGKELDYWIKQRITDKGTKKTTESYYYYVVYSIGKDELDYQIQEAMGKVTAKTQEQQELKTEVEDAMQRLSFSQVGKN